MSRQLKNGVKTVPIGFRGDAELLDKIEALQSAWGPVIPLGASAVIRVCIERVHDAEFFKKKSRSGA
jgi:hypothetical protein